MERVIELTEEYRPRHWGWKFLGLVILALAAGFAWVWLATKTVEAKQIAAAYIDIRLQKAREYALAKLDAPTAMVIAQPASQATIDEIVEQVAKEHSLSPILVRSLIKVESGWNQSAIGFNAGLEGKYNKMTAADHSYMQVSGRWVGNELCPEAKVWSDLYVPRVNILCGVRILKDALGSAKSVTDALSIYNCGRVECEKGQAYAARIAVEILNQMKL